MWVIYISIKILSSSVLKQLKDEQIKDNKKKKIFKMTTKKQTKILDVFTKDVWGWWCLD